MSVGVYRERERDGKYVLGEGLVPVGDAHVIIVFMFEVFVSCQLQKPKIRIGLTFFLLYADLHRLKSPEREVSYSTALVEYVGSSLVDGTVTLVTSQSRLLSKNVSFCGKVSSSSDV